MKQIKNLLLTSMVIVYFSMTSFAQDEKTLQEIVVLAKTYKYLKATGSKDLAQPVKLLERKAATFNVMNSEYYEDDNDTYYISFYLPDGYILAVYDQNGKLLRTAERYKNVALPAAVSNAVVTRFPNWSITKDVYLVNYEDATGAKKQYKLLLKNGNKRMRVKLNDQGTFL